MQEAVRCEFVDGAVRADPRPIPARTTARRERGRVITLDRSFVRSMPEHKLIGPYAVCIAALEHAANDDADEGLFVTEDGLVLEGTATNVFAVNERGLVTAANGVLPGITRAWALTTAASLGIDVEYRAPSIEELRAGAFMTGSLTTLAPIRVLNGHACRAPGPTFEAILARWNARVLAA